MKKTPVSSPSKPMNLSSNIRDNIVVFILSLYLLVDFIPQSGAIDVMGPQWLYISLLNPAVMIYILSVYKHSIREIFTNLSRSTLLICYALFFIFSGLSILFAINQIESLVAYSRLTIGILSLFNISILLYGNLKIFKSFCQVISISLLIQCFPIVYSSLSDFNPILITGNTGNKNIFAASLIAKLPFIMYCLFNSSTLLKNFINVISSFLAISLVFLLLSRSAYVALAIQLIIYLALFAKLYFKKSDLRKSSLLFSKIFGPLIGAFLWVQILLPQLTSFRDSATATTVVDRISTITASNDTSINLRLVFWENALKHIKDHPFTGCGYGNWKIISIAYEKELYDDFSYSKQVHNDFLQIAAESGIHTSMLFLSVFIFSILLIYRVIVSKASREIKVMALFSAIPLSAYFTDALFNFPADHASMQIPLMMSLAFCISVSSYLNIRESNAFNKPAYFTFISIFFVLSFASLYIAHSTYKSMKVQIYTHYDIGRENSRIRWQDLEGKFPAIPNLTESNTPVNVVKAWYLIREAKYDEALYLLNKNENVNPYSMYNEWLKATVFLYTNRADSALYYSKKGLEARPRSRQFYGLIFKSAIALNDPETIVNTFSRYKKYRNDPYSLLLYVRSLFAANYDKRKVVFIADSLSNLYKDDIHLRHTKFFVRAGVAAMNGNYTEALHDLHEILKIFPKDYETMENLGLTYFFLNDFTNASIYFSKVIDSNAYTNGKSEYYLGMSLIRSGRREEACKYLSLSASRNYPNAALTLRNECK